MVGGGCGWLCGLAKCALARIGMGGQWAVCKCMQHSAASPSALLLPPPAPAEWLAHLRTHIGYDGWRLDYVRGFHGSHVKDYMEASAPQFAVGEWVAG